MIKKHTSKDILRAQLVSATVALEFGVPLDELVQSQGRGSPHVVLARQVAAYLFHTIFQANFRRIGQVFYRHPSTISYACAVIEDYRSDPVLDDRLIKLERFLQLSPELQREETDA